MRKECGRINDPQLHDQCMASFDQYEPTMVGSSIPPAPIQRGGRLLADICCLLTRGRPWAASSFRLCSAAEDVAFDRHGEAVFLIR